MPLARSTAFSLLLLSTALAHGPGALTSASLKQRQPARAAELNRDRLIAASRAGGDYLLRVQRGDGSFHYYYNAADDRFESQTYNIVRHAGTALSLLDLYSATRENRYLESARRAVKLLETRFRRVPGRRALYVLDYDGKAKLGANGLALTALAKLIELDPKSSSRTNARRLADLIVMLQRRDGSFHTRYRLRAKDPPGPASLYYPGEAILGLVRLFRLNGDQRLLRTARRGADYLIASQRQIQTLPPDAWLMQALEALYNVGKEKRYADHVIALADAMIADQYSDDDPEGNAGGFGPGPPRVTPAASRAEGMVAAYRIARATGDARASKIATALKASAKFQLTRQLSQENRPAVPNPARAAGGFYEQPYAPKIRIDFVQHNISSLLGVAETLY
ncbi:MAG TPA: beta-L-arabinofuranosidase domain-containing protein [Blastocatellia bacterium]|nr:beta-L-arabinofuranosidase domain-containing protein [Blastocatellia bacterium]